MNDYTKFINFLKRNGIDNKAMFKYIHERTVLIDYSIEEQREIRGVYHRYNKRKELEDFTLYIDTRNEETILLSIRPYIKAIYAYYYLGTEYKSSIEEETFAIYFEKLYLKENPNQKSEEYLNTIYSNIKKENNDSKYKIALNTEEKLTEAYQDQNAKFPELKKHAKRLIKKQSK